MCVCIRIVVGRVYIYPISTTITPTIIILLLFIMFLCDRSRRPLPPLPFPPITSAASPLWSIRGRRTGESTPVGFRPIWPKRPRLQQQCHVAFAWYYLFCRVSQFFYKNTLRNRIRCCCTRILVVYVVTLQCFEASIAKNWLAIRY